MATALQISEFCPKCSKRVREDDEWTATVDEENKRIIAIFHKKCYEEALPQETELNRIFKKPIKKGGLK